MQKLLKIRAALSDSLSNDVGQNASAPSLFEALLTGTPTFSNHFFPLALVFPQDDSLDDVVWLAMDFVFCDCTTVRACKLKICETLGTHFRRFRGFYIYLWTRSTELAIALVVKARKHRKKRTRKMDWLGSDVRHRLRVDIIAGTDSEAVGPRIYCLQDSNGNVLLLHV